MSIPANRMRFPIVAFGGLIISCSLIYLTVNTLRHFNDSGTNNGMYIGAFIGLTIWSLIFTFYSFLDYTKILFDKNAVLTITNNGINDNLSVFSVGHVSWTEITNIKIIKALKTELLIIEVKDPQSFIDKSSKFKRRVLKSFLKKFGSPVVISQKRINYNLIDLKQYLVHANTK